MSKVAIVFQHWWKGQDCLHPWSQCKFFGGSSTKSGGQRSGLRRGKWSHVGRTSSRPCIFKSFLSINNCCCTFPYPCLPCYPSTPCVARSGTRFYKNYTYIKLLFSKLLTKYCYFLVWKLNVTLLPMLPVFFYKFFN